VSEQRDRFLRAARGLPVDATPVWFMRQAGRSLPEYRAVRERHSLMDITRIPELNAEVTMQPVRRLGVDAAILFADISLLVMAMGAELDLVDGVGPVARNPVRSLRDVQSLQVPDPQEKLGHVMESIRILRAELGPTPLIGFAGAPFTLAAYLIEGGPSRDFHRVRSFMLAEPHAWEELMSRLAEATIAYLRAQVGAGVQALQLFDTWAGVLPESVYRALVLPHNRRIFTALSANEVPLIHFSTGSAHLLHALRDTADTVIGIDWRIALGDVWRELGDQVVLQGNLDPALLLTSDSVCLSIARQITEDARGRAHIFNLGHGVLPDTPPDLLARLVETVHEASVRPAAAV
jgi:uroporphyrinogen decarboxylase